MCWTPPEIPLNYNMLYDCGGANSKNIGAALQQCDFLQGKAMRLLDEKVKGRTSRKGYVAALDNELLPDLVLESAIGTK